MGVKGRKMFNIGTQELLIILLVVLLLFGAKRIPEVARSLGKGLGDFRDAMSGVERELKGELQKPGPPRTPPVLAPPAASVPRETTSTPRPGAGDVPAPPDAESGAGAPPANAPAATRSPGAGTRASADAPETDAPPGDGPPASPPASGLAG
jgi:sec-independent protein translocase protein TatA